MYPQIMDFRAVVWKESYRGLSVRKTKISPSAVGVKGEKGGEPGPLE